MTESAVVSKQKMKNQANQRYSKVIYQENDMVLLSSKNISIERLSKKLDNKILSPFQVSKKVGLSYCLDLTSSLKIDNVFHSSLLQKVAIDFIPNNQYHPPMSGIMNNKDEREIDDILDVRYFSKSWQLQYQVK